MMRINRCLYLIVTLALVCISPAGVHAAGDLASFLESDIDDIHICGFLPGFHAHGGVDRARLEAACSPEGNTWVFTVGLRVNADDIVGNSLREAVLTAEPVRYADSSIRALVELVADSGEVMTVGVTVRGHILVGDRVLLPKEPDWFNRVLESIAWRAIDGRVPANSSFPERMRKKGGSKN
jgi:hypothetical protein